MKIQKMYQLNDKVKAIGICKNQSTFLFVTSGFHLQSNALVIGLNLHWQGTWTKAVCAGGGGPEWECTVEFTLGF